MFILKAIAASMAIVSMASGINYSFAKEYTDDKQPVHSNTMVFKGHNGRIPGINTSGSLTSARDSKARV